MMLPLGVSLPDDTANQWRFYLDDFVKNYQTELAAIAWGLAQEWQDPTAFLGLDLLPQPHFIRYDDEELENFNRRVGNHLQELVGIVKNHERETEVAILVLGPGQVKLLFFQPPLSPRQCFEQLAQELDTLQQTLETHLSRLPLGIT
jgi:hypothetical protein